VGAAVKRGLRCHLACSATGAACAELGARRLASPLAGCLALVGGAGPLGRFQPSSILGAWLEHGSSKCPGGGESGLTLSHVLCDAATAACPSPRLASTFPT
jgi:hypothetical protein